eukprot:PhM_4_TR575/c0_g1_i1/m.44010
MPSRTSSSLRSVHAASMQHCTRSSTQNPIIKRAWRRRHDATTAPGDDAESLMYPQSSVESVQSAAEHNIGHRAQMSCSVTCAAPLPATTSCSNLDTMATASSSDSTVTRFARTLCDCNTRHSFRIWVRYFGAMAGSTSASARSHCATSSGWTRALPSKARALSAFSSDFDAGAADSLWLRLSVVRRRSRVDMTVMALMRLASMASLFSSRYGATRSLCSSATTPSTTSVVSSQRMSAVMLKSWVVWERTAHIIQPNAATLPDACSAVAAARALLNASSTSSRDCWRSSSQLKTFGTEKAQQRRSNSTRWKASRAASAVLSMGSSLS